MAARTKIGAEAMVVTVITDPVVDEESRRVLSSIGGCRRVEGSPIVDGTPAGSRSVFEIASDELAAGGLDARIDVLNTYGINVHRVVGDHPAVQRANRRLGYA
jgi:hypothetical protein